MDRSHCRPAGPAHPGGATVSAGNQAAVAGQPGAIIEARGVVKSFGRTPALRGATVSAAQGEILAIMGPSGSGKSTLLHCLAGILVPDEGEVWFAGNRLDTRSEAERSALRRDRFGFVFQSGQAVQQRRLARPARAHHRHDLARARRDRGAAQRRRRAE